MQTYENFYRSTLKMPNGKTANRKTASLKPVENSELVLARSDRLFRLQLGLEPNLTYPNLKYSLTDFFVNNV